MIGPILFLAGWLTLTVIAWAIIHGASKLDRQMRQDNTADPASQVLWAEFTHTEK